MTDAADIARVSGLKHRYGGTEALAGIDLALPARCTVGLIGPDGVGKSSLLGVLAGARRIQEGSVEVLGGDLRRRSWRSRVAPRIAYLPQGLGSNLYGTLSVVENVDFFGRLFGLSAAEREARIAELLARTGLAPFGGRPVAKLSGGMMQKLGLCCALIHDPDLLILDEPTTGVDPLSRREFWRLIADIRARRPAMSVLVATAYMEEAERFDWLVAMDSGRVLATGTPAELLAAAGAADLDAAFISLLPEEKRRGHRTFTIPPRPESGDGPAIEAAGLTKRFNSFTAVDNVSFRIERGEIFGFLGSNGCGKTTTMKMLTGLLPATAGTARLFGEPLRPGDQQTRTRVGYMSQSFSLYQELTVAQNLELHARLFHLPPQRIAGRLAELFERFDLAAYRDTHADDLPLGIRQRLSLAVALVHEPELLILDEPTSGVDPVARDAFWEQLIGLSRRDGVTIFLSTHFMNEAERCDRISLMDAGRVLASDSPAALVAERGAANLEDAFIGYLEQKSGGEPESAPQPPAAAGKTHGPPRPFSLRRLFGYAGREALELRRDPLRLTVALLGSALLLFILGFGITFDVENLRFAVLDRDQTPESREYVRNLAGSRYFSERPPLRDQAELDRRMRSGELSVALEVPPGFGRDLRRGRPTQIGVWIDGAMPFRAETIKGYVRGLHAHFLLELARSTSGTDPPGDAARLLFRYRYNQDFKSIYAMVPAVIPLLLIFIPSILMALGVVREKELGSIVNLYVTPVTRLEFLLGKQLPYLVLGMLSFFTLVALSVWGFGVPLKGSFSALTTGALLYVGAATGLGLLISAFTRTQIAAFAATVIVTLLVAVNFCGMTHPVASLEGAGVVVGRFFPTTYFLIISRGAFTKALGWSELGGQLLALALFLPPLTLVSLALLKKQGR